MTSRTAQKRFFFAIQATVLGLFLGSLFAVLHPETRAGLRASVLTDYRVLVSSARADLVGDGSLYTVAKIKTPNAILLEIFRPDSGGGQTLMEKIEIADAHDGHFNFNGRVANLALEDIDDDGKAEILVPSFDRDLVGRLNVFKYNAGANGFERIVR